MPVHQKVRAALVAAAFVGTLGAGSLGYAAVVDGATSPVTTPSPQVQLTGSSDDGRDDSTTSPTSTSTSTSTASSSSSSSSTSTSTSLPRGADPDISGPCDEAEHVDDARCTGTGGVDDRSGPGRERDDDRSSEDDDEDRSGSNSGTDDDDADRSGSDSGPDR